MGQIRELTQFSMTDFRLNFQADLDQFTSATGSAHVDEFPLKLRVMYFFDMASRTEAGKKALASHGGLENIQRVRVYQPVTGGDFEFRFDEKIPTAVIAERARQAEAAKKKALEAEAEAKRKAIARSRREAEKKRQVVVEKKKALFTKPSDEAFEAAFRQRQINAKRGKKFPPAPRNPLSF